MIKALKTLALIIISLLAISSIEFALTEPDSIIFQGESFESWEKILARGIMIFIGMLVLSSSVLVIFKIFGIQTIGYKGIETYINYSLKLIGNAICLYFSVLIYIAVFYIPYKVVIWLFN